MKTPRDYIDAEFTVVGEEPPKARAAQQWNGVGKPPDWDGWNWVQRIAYVVIYVSLLIGLIWLTHVLTPMIPLPDHW